MKEHDKSEKTEVSNVDLSRKRKNSVITALVLGAIAIGIFVVFVGTAVLGQ